MCGIVGYVGKKESPQFIFDGLRRLEYRGYDSAGIAVVADAKLFLEKASGKLANLEDGLKRLPQQSRLGVGHTRWATHGSPTADNAHPHIVDGVALAHNGIIENYRELKDDLIRQGARFKSETDSEVVAHLLAMHRKKGLSGKDAVSATVKQLKGAYALGIMFLEDTKNLYAVKEGAPLVLGFGDGENFYSSDIMAFNGRSTTAIFLNDGECARISADDYELWDFSGKQLNHTPVSIQWNAASIEKQGYRHFMLKEIHEQPSVTANTINRLVSTDLKHFNEQELGLQKIDFSKVEAIQLTACGTAYLAGLVGKYFLEPMLQIPVSIELASELRYRKPFMRKNTLVIAVSQSGETSDTLATVKYMKELGCQVLSVCNVPYSSIPRESHHTLNMDAGQEIGVASTKAFTSQILCLYLWGLAIAKKSGKMTEAQVVNALSDLRSLPTNIDKALSQEEYIKNLVTKYYEFPNFLYVGRGMNFPLAMEGALKLKEISYIHAEGYAAGELKHGPIALVDRHMPVVALAPKDEYYEKTFSNIQEIHAREGLVIGIGDENDQNLHSICTDFIPCPSVKNQALQAILTSIPIQLLAYYIAVRRGTDVDQPRNLAKSVTVE